jgi:hypothetical protein
VSALPAGSRSGIRRRLGLQPARQQRQPVALRLPSAGATGPSGHFQHTVGFYERLGFRTVRIDPEGYGPGLDRCEMERLFHQTQVAID